MEGVNSQAPKRISRDEMNLAEFPLTVLSTRPGNGVKTLEFSDSIRGKNGELVNRQWIITGADKFGLPTSSDDEVLLGLLKLTVDSGLKERKVCFSRYELLKILHWTTEGRNYSRLQKALDRLSGVRIKATNAFYDNETKLHSTKNFGLVDAYEINDGRDSEKPSFFTWSDVLFKSFQVGFIKKFDLDFYLALRSAVSKRLFRYLDKHFWYRSKIQINLFTLAHEKIGISRNYQYASSLRQQIDPAVDELVECGFLQKAEYVGKGRDTDIILYAASGKPRSLSAGTGQTRSTPESSDAEPQASRGVGEGRSHVATAAVDSREVAELLVARGLKEQQAVRMLEGRGVEELTRVVKIVEHFDALCRAKSKLVSKSPVGFLYRAVEAPDRFVLPGDPPRAEAQGSLGLGEQSETNSSAHRSRGDSAKVAQAELQSRYLIARRVQIKRLMDSVEIPMLQKIEREVQSALAKVRPLISESRFNEAVAHGVEERLARLFALPDFDEWLRTEGRVSKVVNA